MHPHNVKCLCNLLFSVLHAASDRLLLCLASIIFILWCLFVFGWFQQKYLPVTDDNYNVNTVHATCFYGPAECTIKQTDQTLADCELLMFAEGVCIVWIFQIWMAHGLSWQLL